MNKFQIVTPDWVKEQLTSRNVTIGELAKGVNVSHSQVNQWLSETRKPSRAAKAAIYYFLTLGK